MAFAFEDARNFEPTPGAIQTVYTGTLLTRAPKSGGEWRAVRALGGGGPVERLQLVGERYFYDQASPLPDVTYTDGSSATRSVVTGLLGSEDPPIRLLELPTTGKSFEQVWVGTADALFWTDGTKLYSNAVDP